MSKMMLIQNTKEKNICTTCGTDKSVKYKFLGDGKPYCNRCIVHRICQDDDERWPSQG